MRLLLTLALVSVLSLESGSATAAAGDPVGIVGYQGGRAGAIAVLSPRTLAPRSRPVPLRGYRWGSTLDPSCRRAAIGVTGGSRVRLAGARLQLVDLARGRTQALLRLTRRDGAVTAVAWPRARRVVAIVGATGDGRSSLAVIDPVARRVLARRPITGAVLASVQRPAGLVLLVAPRRSIGAASLVVVTATGVPRTIPLPEISAGIGPLEGQPPRSTYRNPGLAVDAAGARAWVVAADGPRVAEVDLRSSTVSMHAMPEAGAAKGGQGSLRTATWLRDDTLAVTGYDETAPVLSPRGPESSLRPYGLRLLDLRTWELRTVDPKAENLTVGAAGLVVAQAHGVRVYDVAGRPRFRRLDAFGIVRLSLAGHRLYASAQRPRHRTFVLDLRSGRTVARLPTAEPPLLLTREDQP